MSLLSVVIPAKNESKTIEATIKDYVDVFEQSVISYEILIENDYSDDDTEYVLKGLSELYSSVIYINNKSKGGVGNAIKYGINKCHGDIVAICMADGSDSAMDVLKLSFFIIKEDYDCAFGSRFLNGSEILNYPKFKLILNRIFYLLVRVVTRYPYNDYTNLFKVYKMEVVESILPIKSEGFSIGLEMCIKSFKNALTSFLTFHVFLSLQNHLLIL